MINPHDVPMCEASEEQNTKNFPNRLHKIATAGALGIMSIAGFVGQRKGIIQGFPQPARSAAESCSHPALGYVGAWVATKVGSRFTDKFKVSTAVVGASTMNFVTETLQGTILNDNLGNYSFMAEANRYETTKDYVAALLGMGIFLLMDRNPSETPTPDV